MTFKEELNKLAAKNPDIEGSFSRVAAVIEEMRRAEDEEEYVSGDYDSRPDTYAHIQTVQKYMNVCVQDLMDRALVHDQSKLKSPEREIFDEYTPKLRDSTYGSDEYEGFREGMGEALDHHYANNSHHPEFYENGIEDMSLMDVVEMLCDWKAATERHEDGDLMSSIEINQERFGYSDEMKAILINTAEWLESQ